MVAKVPLDSSNIYDPRIINDPEYSVQTGDTVRGGQTSTVVGAIDITNHDGLLNAWRKADIRNKQLIYRIGRSGDPMVNWAVIQRLADRAFPTIVAGRQAIRIIAVDLMAELEQTVQTQYFNDSAQNESIRGAAVPVSLGHVLQAPGTLTNTNTYDYVWHDDQIEDIDPVRDNGQPLDDGIDYVQTTQGADLDNAIGEITADVIGTREPDGGFLLGSEMVVNGNFSFWSGNNPNNWSVVETGFSSEITQSPSGQCSFIHTGGFSFPSISQNLGLVIDQQYQLKLNLNAIPSGATLTISNSGTSIASLNSASGTGLKTIDFVAAGDTLTIQAVIFGFSNVTIDNVSVKEKQPTYQPLVTTGGLIRHIVVDRFSRAVDQATLDALDTSIGSHEMGRFLSAPEKGADVIRLLLNSFSAIHYVNPAGELAVTRLELPTGTPDVIIQDYHIAGEISMRKDLAPGLSTRLAGARNIRPLERAVTSGALADSKITKAEQETMSANYRHIVMADDAIVLNPFYQQAKNACAIATDCNTKAANQAEVDRRVGMYVDIPNYIDVPVAIEAVNLSTLRPCQEFRLITPKHGLDAGVDTRIVDWSGTLRSDQIVLTLWAPQL